MLEKNAFKNLHKEHTEKWREQDQKVKYTLLYTLVSVVALALGIYMSLLCVRDYKTIESANNELNNYTMYAACSMGGKEFEDNFIAYQFHLDAVEAERLTKEYENMKKVEASRHNRKSYFSLAKHVNNKELWGAKIYIHSFGKTGKVHDTGTGVADLDIAMDTTKNAINYGRRKEKCTIYYPNGKVETKFLECTAYEYNLYEGGGITASGEKCVPVQFVD